MWNRILIATILVGLVSAFTTSYAANSDDSSDDISPAAVKALESHDYEQIALALFSAQTPADIAALTPEFERLQAKTKPGTRNRNSSLSISDWIYASELAIKIANDQKLSNKMKMDTYLRLQKGDVLLRRTGVLGCKKWIVVPLCQFWAFMYEHSGIYYGYRTQKYPEVYESTSNGGVQFTNISTWREKNLYVGMHRSTIEVNKIAAVFEQLINKYGAKRQTPYNYNLANKYTDKALYCSQLVWKFYLMLGMDVDSNDPMYAAWLRLMYGTTVGNYVSANAVAPDEIGLSSKLIRVATGWNN